MNLAGIGLVTLAGYHGTGQFVLPQGDCVSTIRVELPSPIQAFLVKEMKSQGIYLLADREGVAELGFAAYLQKRAELAYLRFVILITVWAFVASGVWMWGVFLAPPFGVGSAGVVILMSGFMLFQHFNNLMKRDGLARQAALLEAVYTPDCAPPANGT